MSTRYTSIWRIKVGGWGRALVSTGAVRAFLSAGFLDGMRFGKWRQMTYDVELAHPLAEFLRDKKQQQQQLTRFWHARPPVVEVLFVFVLHHQGMTLTNETDNNGL